MVENLLNWQFKTFFEFALFFFLCELPFWVFFFHFLIVVLIFKYTSCINDPKHYLFFMLAIFLGSLFVF